MDLYIYLTGSGVGSHGVSAGVAEHLLWWLVVGGHHAANDGRGWSSQNSGDSVHG